MTQLLAYLAVIPRLSKMLRLRNREIHPDPRGEPRKRHNLPFHWKIRYHITLAMSMRQNRNSSIPMKNFRLKSF